MGKIIKNISNKKTPHRPTHVTNQKRISEYLKVVSNTKVKSELSTHNTAHHTKLNIGKKATENN